ncbi:hypothetical protein GCK32_019915 [Trichostrongylus colubriformis]|uniref:Uncharacterized protein n=1 Tax=Trichostrongylus colubriformis TaxID=6319 RepID=A0AAN8ILD8_TRICO
MRGRLLWRTVDSGRFLSVVRLPSRRLTERCLQSAHRPMRMSRRCDGTRLQPVPTSSRIYRRSLHVL